MHSPQGWKWLLSLAVAVSGLVPAARAALLTPNGNPTGALTATSPPQPDGFTYTVSLDLASGGEVIERWNPLDVLAAQGFSAANGWTITRFAFQGDHRLDTYYAWAEGYPVINQGALQVGPGGGAGSGGAAIGLHYLPRGTDPTGAAVHWLQIIETNFPAAGAVGIRDPFYGDPYVLYLDDVGNPAGNPFYDGIANAPADATDFIDAPSRPYRNNTDWNAWLFMATGDLAAHTLSFSDVAVHYGFIDPAGGAANPEPSSLTLIALGGLGLLGYAWRRQRAA
jgi:hypothetical protein